LAVVRPQEGVCGGVKILALPYYSQRGLLASMGAAAGQNFLPRLTTASAQCLRLSERFFIFAVFYVSFHHYKL